MVEERKKMELNGLSALMLGVEERSDEVPSTRRVLRGWLRRIRSSWPDPSVVAVGAAQRDREHPLAEELLDLVSDLAGRSSVAQTRGHFLAQPQPFVHSFEQQSAAVGPAVGLVEGRHDRL